MRGMFLPYTLLFGVSVDRRVIGYLRSSDTHKDLGSYFVSKIAAQGLSITEEPKPSAFMQAIL